MTSIDLCICTFRRAHIADTLQSVAALALPTGYNLHVIVADNDETPSARELVEQTAGETGLSVSYLHAPARNISIARNACLAAATAPLLAFIDDDELATPGWLEAAVAELTASGADAVLGPVRAIYPAGSPAWLQTGDFHSTAPTWVGREIRTGYSCNVLLKRLAGPFVNRRFRLDLGRTGGEDTVFFAKAFQAGAKIAYAEAALVTEPVTRNRLSFGWLLRRRFRAGQTHALLLLEAGHGRLASLGKASGKLLACCCMAAFSVARPGRARYWVWRGMLHAGVVAKLLGGGVLEQYG